MAGIFNFLKSLIAVIISIVTVSTPLNKSVVGYTDGTPIIATQREYKYDNDKLLIGGYSFDLNHTDDEHVSWVKEAGIDFLVSNVNEDFLNLCDKYGVGVIAKRFELPTYYYECGDGWLNISDEAVNSIKEHECVWGNDLIDEPYAGAFDRIGKSVENYYDKLGGNYIPYVNLFPIYAKSEQLGTKSTVTEEQLQDPDFAWYHEIESVIDRYKQHVSEYVNNIDTDFISTDIYPFGFADEKYNTNPLWLRNLDILAEACRETDRDLWVITQAFGDYPETNGWRRTDTADIRMQAYVTLSFGAKAIVHACYDGGFVDKDTNMIDTNGNKTDVYTAVQTVNNELKAFADIYGQYENHGAYIAGDNTKSAFFMSSGNMAVQYLYNYELQNFAPVDRQYKPTVFGTDPVLVGCFSGDDGSSAYTIVNMTERNENKSSKSTIVFDEEKEITVYRKGVANTVKARSITLQLETFEGVFVTVK